MNNLELHEIVPLMRVLFCLTYDEFCHLAFPEVPRPNEYLEQKFSRFTLNPAQSLCERLDEPRATEIIAYAIEKLRKE